MKTEYYKTWEQYKAGHSGINENVESEMAPKMQKYEEMMFIFVLNLLM
ncbi:MULTISPECIES: hypothetical protein [Clostridium]|jgi:hypothetical protein|uniref:Uncharacterized protein n=1 Tax=Clostridium lapidicellarium TaxID=3240931 RepID=A0ABV4DYU6_9CLOT|nr:hypothetical protein [uncultured Clostridium sp.]NLU08314.1 hypothetical protein [Clostridiales bacterium]